MIGLDTNILVRYFARDDDVQWPAAAKLLKGLTSDEPGFVSLVVLAELVWVLETAYGTTRDRIGEIVAMLLDTRELVLQDTRCVNRALGAFRRANIDFADALIVALDAAAGCSVTFTFDRNAAKRAGMRLLA